MFDSLTIREARPIVWLKRVFAFVVVALLAIGMVSTHRAWVQVRNLDLNAPQTLSAGSVLQTSVLTSGRTMVDVEVDLIQGTQSQRLFTLHVRGNELGFFDPRTKAAAQSFTLTSEMLARFQPGGARLRAVATGREQFTRLPPPTVRELEVVIAAH